MRRGLATLLCLLLSSCASPPRDTGKLVFWEARRGDAVVWLLGSVHLATDPVDFDPAIRDALAASHTLVVEIPPDEIDPRAFVAMGTLTHGERLPDLLTPETWEALAAHARERGILPAGLARLKPWAAVLALQAADLMKRGFDPQNGVEARLVAAAGDKPVVGLETVEFQLGLLDALPLETQELLVRDYLESAEAGGSQAAERIQAAWSRGDLEGIERETLPKEVEDEGLAALYDALYFQRNRNMAARIDALAGQGGQWFVAVGAGHMVGDEGIPELLAERAFLVRRVPRSALARLPDSPRGIGTAPGVSGR